tara:strand:+ start:268 stop:489 length:222 start_codon:yes stop_codon:yes gene_type:complete
MKKKISLVWFRHPRPGIHYAHHRGRVILLHGFPKATRSAREFEVYDGRTRVGLIRGLNAAMTYAEKHLADLEE